MALKSDDSDLQRTWLKTYLGGNGDYYISIVSEDEETKMKSSHTVRVSTSGGYCKSPAVRRAVADLWRAMEESELNGFPDED